MSLAVEIVVHGRPGPLAMSYLGEIMEDLSAARRLAVTTELSVADVCRMLSDADVDVVYVGVTPGSGEPERG